MPRGGWLNCCVVCLCLTNEANLVTLCSLTKTSLSDWPRRLSHYEAAYLPLFRLVMTAEEEEAV